MDESIQMMKDNVKEKKYLRRFLPGAIGTVCMSLVALPEIILHKKNLNDNKIQNIL